MARFDNSTGPSQRQLRVGEQVRHALAQLLQRGDVADPELDGALVSVSEVRMSPDLKIATVFVTPFGGGDPDQTVKALARNAKFIRGKMSPALSQMKFMPQLRFRADESFDNFAKIDSLLRSPEVARDLDDDDETDEMNMNEKGDDR